MKHLLSLCVLLVALSAAATTTYYVSDEETNFSNPERGFYTASEQSISQSTTSSNLTDGAFNASSGRSLIMRQYVFTGFREDSLSTDVLALINADFAKFRAHGFKCVLRFSYTVDGDEQDAGIYRDASPEIWAKHLQQLKPVMAANADVIATVQAGFLGVWGEWYFSSCGVGASIPSSVKTNLIDQLLDAVPVSRTVQLRTPKYKTDYIGDTNPLTASEAFTGTPRARLAHHNDAFLYQADNMGTYTNRTRDMAYLAQECLYLPNGGESDVTTQSVYNGWATGEKAIADMSMIHFSYLNQDYSQLVISNWRKEGAFTEIAMHMGYRFQLIEATLPALIRPNEALPVRMNIRNTGYATPYNERHAYIVLYNSSNNYMLPLESDPRFWAPNNEVTEIDEQLTLPSDLEEGAYDVALYLPDASASIAADPRFAIRLANYNMWDETTGYNNLNMRVMISATAAEPEPEADPIPQPGIDAISNFRGAAGMSDITLRWENPVISATADTIYVDMSQGMDTAYNAALGNSSANVSYDNGISTVNYTTNSAWLWAGAKFPVNNLTGITAISFDYKGDGSRISLISYAHDGSYRWIEDEGSSVQLSSTSWQTYRFTPGSPLWTDATPTHQFGEVPITDIGFIANPMTATSGSFQLRNLFVEKELPVEDTFAAVRIIRKEGSAPTSFNDGTTVYYGRGTHLTDSGLEFGATYYYAAYTFHTDGQVSMPVVIAVTVDGTQLNNVETSESAQKLFKDGRVVILRNGVYYDIMGRRQ